MMAREEYREGKDVLVIQSILHHHRTWWMWACFNMAASGTGLLIFIDDVTADLPGCGCHKTFEGVLWYLPPRQ